MRYDLVGQDGNAYFLMGYTARAMKECGLEDEVDEMRNRATSGDYNNLICVCDEYIQRCNDVLRENGEYDDDDDYEEDYDDDDYFVEEFRYDRLKTRGADLLDMYHDLQNISEFFGVSIDASFDQQLVEFFSDHGAMLEEEQPLFTKPLDQFNSELLNIYNNTDRNDSVECWDALASYIKDLYKENAGVNLN